MIHGPERSCACLCGGVLRWRFWRSLELIASAEPLDGPVLEGRTDP